VRCRSAVLAGLAALAVAAPAASAQEPPPPPGQLVATGIPYATNLTFDARGGMWVTSGAPFSQEGDGVWYVARPGAKPVHAIRGTKTALGLTWFRGRLYVAYALSQVTGVVARYSGFDGRRFAHRRTVIPALSIGLHGLASILQGPNARLYLGVGAEHDASAGGCWSPTTAATTSASVARPTSSTSYAT
jgi:hypothetical protein